MALTRAPHMVDTRLQTVLFKSVMLVPDTPNKSLVNRDDILWNYSRYLQKPLEQIYHDNRHHAKASLEDVASVSNLHQPNTSHLRKALACLLFLENIEDRHISLSSLEEASSRSVGWPDPNVLLPRSSITHRSSHSSLRTSEPTFVQPIPFCNQQQT
ncbi:hypothetical protein AOQ84DRAFT_5717 [Glonium stellatum]|uniref:Uncharacterized protein n=1 Tax=Glonium stellatum TaxID=574774 RepID=A0A8E2F3Z8_9PEZI|nr:hypothetical protein AOQ84DRAFT_5717 [Glonium stellatum]